MAHTGLLVSSKVQNEVWPVAVDRNDTVLAYLARRQISAAHVLTNKTMEVPMKLSRLLFGIAVLSILFVAIATETHAKDRARLQRSQYARGSELEETKQLRLTSKQLRVRGLAGSLSKHKLERLIKAASKRCGCASPAQDADFSSGCFTSCVARYVGWQTALACAVACGGNPAGCAVCVGVHEWVVLGCVQYCVWRDVFSFVDGSVSSNRGSHSTRGKAKPLIRSPGRASSS